QPCRLAGARADEVHAPPQPEDRQCPRPHSAAVASPTRRRGDRVKRRNLLALTGAALLRPIVGEAQSGGKIPRIGYLGTDLSKTSREAFLQGLEALGYVEGRSLVIEYRYGEGQNFEKLPALAAELVALKVDVVVAVAGTLAALAAKQATGTIPVVFIAVA